MNQSNEGVSSGILMFIRNGAILYRILIFISLLAGS